VNFVLVHGSWHVGSCWSQVRSVLEADGHQTMAPTLPGNGPGADAAVTFAQTSAAVVSAVRDTGWQQVVLVGHSFGGAVIQQVALQIPDLIGRLVFFNAYAVADGAAVFDYVPASSAEAFMALAKDGTVMLPFEVFREAFINDADIDTARDAYAQLSPEPLARASEPLDLAGWDTLAVPRSVLHATDDNVFPATEFSWHPGMSQRVAPFRLVQMHGSHEVLFSDPAATARKLVEAGRD
jgi:pimeloyl-ACP methyl ester carboxylesterase